MKKIALFNYIVSPILFLGLSLTLNAQLENANWHFGSHIGLKFDDISATPTVLASNMLVINGGSASISDATGKVLFFTNGVGGL